MWLLIFAGLLTITVGKETVSNVADKPEVPLPAKPDDVVLLEIDVKEPAKRSPLTASAVYGASPSQYIIRHGDDAQELSPEYLSLLQQYAQPQEYSASPSPVQSQASTRRPLPGYARQQQQLQQAYHRHRVPSVAPPRPPLTLHPQALAQAEVTAELHAHKEAQYRSQALQSARLRPSSSDTQHYQASSASYSGPKLGTFEQELLQLVNANQAQEFKLLPAEQPKRLLKENSYAPQYSQQLLSYPAPQYTKPVSESVGLPEQYHIETTQPQYQPQPIQHQHGEDVVQLQYHQAVVPEARVPVQQYVKSKPTRPSPQYQYVEDPARLQAEAEAQAQAQARAEAQALAYQKIAQDSHNKHQQAAIEQIRLVHERHRQQAALEQIREGSQLSEAGRAHLEEQYQPKDPEAAYRARLKAQATAEAAEQRRAQEAAEYKAHSDAILKLQAQQQAHLKQQEDAHRNALAFERNQLQAQAQAQALANAQAQALYKAHQQARAKANSEAQAAARAQAEARKLDPENTPVVQYLLPNNIPLPSPNSYLTNDQVTKYQASGSTYVPRMAPKATEPTSVAEEPAYIPSSINQPRQPHKHKIPPSSSSIYVSQSGLLKKAPVKSVTIEEIIEQDQLNAPHFIRVPSPKGRTLTQDDLAALINAGYTVTPVPDTAKPTQPSYSVESTLSGYYVKKQRAPIRPDYITYEEIVPQKRPYRKQSRILKQGEHEGEASEKITYLVPVEPSFGTRKPPKSDE